jgi:hypothetical protein
MTENCDCYNIHYHALNPQRYSFLLLGFILQQLSESVTAVQGGVIATQGFDEIVCSTYAGKKCQEQVHKVLFSSLL